MATGIPPKTKTVKRKIPVVVSYDGKVNVDEQIELAMKFNITSIPTVMVFKNGNPAATSVGFCAKEHLEEMIK